MGTFDSVRYEAPCPECGEILKDWQSKDGRRMMAVIEPWEVGNFHTSCPCGAWIEATVDAEVEHIVKRCDVTLTVKILEKTRGNCRGCTENKTQCKEKDETWTTKRRNS